MWGKQKSRATNTVEPRRPTDEALLEALRLNDDHIRGLTRLDKELVYVPLTALGAAVFAELAAATPLAFGKAACGCGSVVVLVLVVLLVLVAVVVVQGLLRNQDRHVQLLGYRDLLMRKLELPAIPEVQDLGRGRRIYAGLFLLGWVLGSLTLVSLLSR
ncbi:MAG TPA: hypothetical protein DCK98_14310 [Chloroflexi bacterium]|nr:hypothetical protein [Chloroflexota bacterium]HAL28759.1 hypothetical protein [Chloroflexota bacterium]